MRFRLHGIIKPPYLLLPLACMVGNAMAGEFQLGEIEGQLDSSLSIGPTNSSTCCNGRTRPR